jgi:glutamate-1-semialdehyde 2,1-aminomutase
MSATVPQSRPLLAELEIDYRRRAPKSELLHHELSHYLPAGETRSITYYAPFPLTLERGHGALVVDADGNEYVDVLNNYTALVHGHAFAPIVDALAARLRLGTAFPAPSREQLALARLLTERYPAVERVRFTNSGTEAAILALRICRYATGRRRFVIFKDAYHGTAPEFNEPTGDTLVLPYNDSDRLTAAVDSQVAAIFVEPFLGSGGVITATESFLSAVEATAGKVGALFVLDEVQSLRNHVHGVHGQLGLRPDLVLMGKIIGGGLPVGAVGGRADLMELTAASRADRLPHSGTFNGNPLTMVAGVESLQSLNESAIERLNGRAAALATRIDGLASARDLPVYVTRAGSIMHVHVSPSEDSVRRALHLSLLLSGVYPAPRGMLNLSTAITDEQLERVVNAYDQAFDHIYRAGT